MRYMTLNSLMPGEKARVYDLRAVGSMRRRFLDIGLIKGTEVECVGKSPMGDPVAFMIRGAVIAIRCEDCNNILIIKDNEAISN